jgi:hypothetical protein
MQVIYHIILILKISHAIYKVDVCDILVKEFFMQARVLRKYKLKHRTALKNFVCNQGQIEGYWRYSYKNGYHTKEWVFADGTICSVSYARFR